MLSDANCKSRKNTLSLYSNGHWHKLVNDRMMTGAYIVEMCPVACKTGDIHLDDRDIDLGIGLPQSFEGMDEDKELLNLLKSKISSKRSRMTKLERFAKCPTRTVHAMPLARTVTATPNILSSCTDVPLPVRPVRSWRKTTEFYMPATCGEMPSRNTVNRNWYRKLSARV